MILSVENSSEERISGVVESSGESLLFVVKIGVWMVKMGQEETGG